MVDSINPEIRKRMPFGTYFKNQQDNARPHIGHDMGIPFKFINFFFIISITNCINNDILSNNS